MDYNFLSDKIKKELDELLPNIKPLAVVRGNGNLEGGSGEGFAVSYDDRVLFFSRGMGESEYKISSGSLEKDILSMELKKDKFNSCVEIQLPEQKFSFKISSFEEKDFIPILEQWKQVRNSGETVPDVVTPPPIPDIEQAEVPAESDSQAQSDEQKILSPVLCLATSLMYLASIDDEIAKDEDDFIRRTCNNSDKILKLGLNYYKNHKVDDLLPSLASMDHQQKLCVLANLFDLGMSDGILHRSEQNLIQTFSEAMGLSEDEYQTIKDVLIIKNQVSVLC